MAVPSSPGWKFGYVPSPGEWANVFAGKADYPVPIDQGGTGAQSGPAANYALQQRAQVITSTFAAVPLTFYSIRTDLTGTTGALPPASTCKAGDWIDMLDYGNNASGNNIAIAAADGDTILTGQSSVTTLLLQDDGVSCIFVTDGVHSWRAHVPASSGNAALPVPKQIVDTDYILQLSDAGQYLQFLADTPVTVHVPANVVVSFALGAVIIMEQYGTGVVLLSPSPEVVLNGRNGIKTAGQFAVMQMKNGSNTSPDIWTVLGDTAS